MQVTRYVETGGAEGIGRLAVFIPPRHGKSMTVARLFPAWFLGRNPDSRVLLTGYGASLVDQHSRFARNLLQTERYQAVFPDVLLAPDSRARSAWDIAGRMGGMDAVGIGGAVTGKGAHLLIIDDPVKNREQAESTLIRQRIWDSYTSDLYTRLEPGGAMALIMTRWHEDDLSGRILKRLLNRESGSRDGASDDGASFDGASFDGASYDGVGWTVIRLPALAEEDDPLGRPLDAPLWADRYPAARLNAIRADIGAYAFFALYQQRPKPREGALFRADWIDAGRVPLVPTLRRIVIAVDPAVSAASGSDETGIIAAGVVGSGRDAHVYILEDASLRGSPTQWARAALALYHQYRADALVVEVNQGGDMVASTLRTIDPNVRIREVQALRGKALRAEPVAALYEQGRAHHARSFPQLEDQMCQWTPTDTASPDRLDALVWALTDLALTKTGIGIR